MIRTIVSALLAMALLPIVPAAAQDAAAASNTIQIVVPAHDIARGEVLDEQDLDYANIAPQRFRTGLVTAFADLEGREARRALRAGDPVRSDDVRRPVLVTKGSTVTMVFSTPGITLTAVGRAMSEGGLGESVVVQNPVSFRQVSCVVTGAGEVRAGDATLDPAAQAALAR